MTREDDSPRLPRLDGFRGSDENDETELTVRRRTITMKLWLFIFKSTMTDEFEVSSQKKKYDTYESNESSTTNHLGKNATLTFGYRNGCDVL